MIEDYKAAKKRGEREYRRALSRGEYPYPPALDDFLEKAKQGQQIPLGITELPLRLIAGTKTAGRQNAFSCGFMPLLSEKSEFAMKWSNLYESQMEEGLRDPILVYEYMNRFYVQEGNKRVSVMKYLGSYAITADVIRIMPEKNQNPDTEIYYEFVDFYNVTRLNIITFSEKGRYAELAQLLGEDLLTPWPADKLEALKSAFLHFEELYERKNPKGMEITTGDAFLLFLRVFSLDSLLNDTEDSLRRRVDKMWAEFLTADKDDRIELIEVPEDAAKPAAQSGLKKLFSSTPRYTQSSPLKVAFLYEKTPELSPWIYGHELGRTELEDNFYGLVKTKAYEQLNSEELVKDALEKAAEEGYEVIVTTSASMMPIALPFAIEHPELKILNCSINLSHNAVRTYYSRMYEAKFLMGALAASLCDSDRIGYLADYPVYGSIAGINAFAIGASLVRPQVKVHLKWSTQKDMDWKKDFSWEGINVISGPDFIRPDSDSREYGLYYKKDDTLTRLAAPIWHWGKYYKLIVRSVMDGSYGAALPRPDQALNYWYGMSAGVIDVILSQKLTYYSQKLVEMLKREIVSGDLMPFEGVLKAQDGTCMADAGQILTSREIITMDWLSDNVYGEIPPLKTIQESAKKTIIVSGVEKATSGGGE